MRADVVQKSPTRWSKESSTFPLLGPQGSKQSATLQTYESTPSDAPFCLGPGDIWTSVLAKVIFDQLALPPFVPRIETGRSEAVCGR